MDFVYLALDQQEGIRLVAFQHNDLDLRIRRDVRISPAVGTRNQLFRQRRVAVGVTMLELYPLENRLRIRAIGSACTRWIRPTWSGTSRLAIRVSRRHSVPLWRRGPASSVVLDSRGPCGPRPGRRQVATPTKPLVPSLAPTAAPRRRVQVESGVTCTAKGSWRSCARGWSSCVEPQPHDPHENGGTCGDPVRPLRLRRAPSCSGESSWQPTTRVPGADFRVPPASPRSTATP